MRSSVIESQSEQDAKTRSIGYTPRPASQIRHSQPPQPSIRNSRSSLTLAPAEGWLPLVLLAVAAYCVVFAIASVNWVSHTFILYWSTTAGLLVGLGIAKIQRMPQTLLHLGAVLIGHWISIWLTSVIAFHVSWLLLLASLRSLIVGGFANALTANSEMVFLFYLSFLCFFLGYFGAWLTYRAHLPWLVALVFCAILLVNLNYVKQDLSPVVFILLAALIVLIGRIQLASQLSTWISEGLHTDRSWLQGITRRFVQFTCIFALLTLLISWILPVMSEPAAGTAFWDHLDNTWANITHGQLSLQNPATLFRPYQAPTNLFGDKLTISGDVNLPSGEVLYYTTSAGAQPHYLEGFTYDHFDGHTWTSSTSNEVQNFSANASLPLDPIGNYTGVTTSVTIERPPQGSRNYIFAPAQPASFNVPTTLFTNVTTTAWMQTGPLTQGEHYQVASDVSTEPEQDLSLVPFPQNGQKNALWLSDGNISALGEYYLQTPYALSATVSQTAQQWTRGAVNPYEAMKMLQSRLSNQSEFTYSTTNPPVPANVDAVSWLLQTHTGYCTYYATAMTIMARLLGMPARIVNGFTQGHFDAQRKVWVVNGSDAHSWVQVYFPDFGWINFDPTPGYFLTNTGAPAPRPTVSPTPTKAPLKPTPAPAKKPARAYPTPPTHTASSTATPSQNMIAFQNILLGLMVVTLLFSLCMLFIAICTYWWRNLYSHSTFVSGLFWRACRLASWAGLPPQQWQTPYEYTGMLGRRLPQTSVPLRRLTELFVRDRWAGPRETPHPTEEDDLERIWPHLRTSLVRFILFRSRNAATKRKHV